MGVDNINVRTDDDDFFPVPSGCCGQLFHTWCLNTWLRQRNTCPLCRREQVLPPARRPIVVEIQNDDDGFDIQPVSEVPDGWAEFMRENPHVHREPQHD